MVDIKIVFRDTVFQERIYDIQQNFVKEFVQCTLELH